MTWFTVNISGGTGNHPAAQLPAPNRHRVDSHLSVARMTHAAASMVPSFLVGVALTNAVWLRFGNLTATYNRGFQIGNVTGFLGGFDAGRDACLSQDFTELQNAEYRDGWDDALEEILELAMPLCRSCGMAFCDALRNVINDARA